MKTKFGVARDYLKAWIARGRDIHDPEIRDDVVDAVFAHVCNDYPNHETREQISLLVDNVIGFLSRDIIESALIANRSAA